MTPNLSNRIPSEYLACQRNRSNNMETYEMRVKVLPIN